MNWDLAASLVTSGLIKRSRACNTILNRLGNDNDSAIVLTADRPLWAPYGTDDICRYICMGEVPTCGTTHRYLETSVCATS